MLDITSSFINLLIEIHLLISIELNIGTCSIINLLNC